MRRLIFALIVAACGGGGGSSNDGGTSDSGGNDAGGSDVVTNETGPAPINGLRVFFSDLESGPNGGGQNGKGAFVTIWGNGFGATQGSSTVSIGGGAADNYPTWTSTKITFQLGAAAKTGDVVVHVSGKGDSNALPFTVRSGNVFFVMTSGDDTHDGSLCRRRGRRSRRRRTASQPATSRTSATARLADDARQLQRRAQHGRERRGELRHAGHAQGARRVPGREGHGRRRERDRARHPHARHHRHVRLLGDLAARDPRRDRSNRSRRRRHRLAHRRQRHLVPERIGLERLHHGLRRRLHRGPEALRQRRPRRGVEGLVRSRSTTTASISARITSSSVGTRCATERRAARFSSTTRRDRTNTISSCTTT